MTAEEARELFAYNAWANDRMLASLEPLTDEQLNRDLASSFPTILRTVAHIAGAEWVWLSRWRGVPPPVFPEWALAPERAAVHAKFREIEADRTSYLNGLTDADFDRRIDYRTFAGVADRQPLHALIRHVVNHGTYHRGQVATMIRQVGGKAIGTDFIAWIRR